MPTPKHKIAVEIEGGAYAGGGHVRGAKYRKDCEKYNTAVLMGWRILRYSDKRDFPQFLEHYATLTRREAKQ